MKYLMATVLVALLALPGTSHAKGCVKGAVIGGVAGHFAGHHGMLGAAAGCAIGHHEAERDNQSRDTHDTDRGPAHLE
jgi:uncharacterized protein YcfJ